VSDEKKQTPQEFQKGRIPLITEMLGSRNLGKVPTFRVKIQEAVVLASRNH